MFIDMIRQFFSKKPALTAYPDTRPYASNPAGRRQRPVPEQIGRIYIPLSVMQATDGFMRGYEVERYVWWGGYFTQNGDAQVLTALGAETRTSYGNVHLTAQQLQVLQSKLRALDQVLIAELHTHPPGAGGQNSVDAAHPAATYPGFVTIVVPDFAQPRFHDLAACHVYEYIANLRWRQLNAATIRERFVIEESGIRVPV
jgi:hypothetical protein